jgi:hypothetical protein
MFEDALRQLVTRFAEIAADRVVTPMCPGIHQQVKEEFMRRFTDELEARQPAPVYMAACGECASSPCHAICMCQCHAIKPLAPDLKAGLAAATPEPTVTPRASVWTETVVEHDLEVISEELDFILSGQRELTPAEQRALRGIYDKLYKKVSIAQPTVTVGAPAPQPASGPAGEGAERIELTADGGEGERK